MRQLLETKRGVRDSRTFHTSCLIDGYPLHHRKRTSIAHTTLTDSPHLTTPLIPHKPKLPQTLLTILLLQLLYRRHHHTDRMPTAYRIPVLLQAAGPGAVTAAFTRSNALEVDVGDGVVDRSVLGRFGGGAEVDGRAGGGAVVGVAEAETPVREVRRDDEGGCWVGQVWCEDVAEVTFGGGGGVTYHYWDEWWKLGGVIAEGSGGRFSVG